MPKLDWVGKQYVVNHVDDVPFRLLQQLPDSSMGESSGNMIVHGDNLEALKALMPYYRERVKLVFIDPPRNAAHYTPPHIHLAASLCSATTCRVYG